MIYPFEQNSSLGVEVSVPYIFSANPYTTVFQRFYLEYRPTATWKRMEVVGP